MLRICEQHFPGEPLNLRWTSWLRGTSLLEDEAIKSVKRINVKDCPISESFCSSRWWTQDTYLAPILPKVLLKLSFRILKIYKPITLKRGGGGHQQIREVKKFLEYIKFIGAIIRRTSWRKPHTQCSMRGSRGDGSHFTQKTSHWFREVHSGKGYAELHSKSTPSWVLLYSTSEDNQGGISAEWGQPLAWRKYIKNKQAEKSHPWGNRSWETRSLSFFYFRIFKWSREENTL